MSHWTKPDHVTFLIAFVLSITNVFLLRQDVMILIFIFLLIALVYDIYETKK